MPNFIYQPPTTAIEILHDDDDILIVNKPAGLLSVPGRLAEHQDNLLGRLQRDFGELHCIHRLDMDTSGIMILARNKKALSYISKQFQNRSIKKTYQAIIWGTPEQKIGEINLPLITDWPNRPRQKICHETGKPSLTKYKFIEKSGNDSLIELYPITGRSHQLRLHMQSIGHPILGCRFYAHEKAQQAAGRLQLHASHICFTHPTTDSLMTIHSAAEFWLKK